MDFDERLCPHCGTLRDGSILPAAPTVDFPYPILATYNAAQEVVEFFVLVGGHPVRCRITRATLRFRLGIQGQSPQELVAGVLVHRQPIEDITRRLVCQGRVDEHAELVITLRDVP
jgi:hypothetical protein